MLPSLFGENLLDDVFEDAFAMVPVWNRRNPLYGKHGANLMKTDVREKEDSYELDVDLPGFRKEDIEATVENGYLTIRASKGTEKEEKNEEGKYVRRERYTGQCSRSFYVGQGVKEEDVRAKLEDGILRISIPKKSQQSLPEKHAVTIK